MNKSKLKVTVLDMDNHVIWFTDRPKREASHCSLNEFVKAWNQGKDSFQENPPNASLITFDDRGRENEIVFEMTYPQISDSGFLFTANILEGQKFENAISMILFIDPGVMQIVSQGPQN